MHKKSTYSRRGAFTLIELLIVIIIISVVYFLGFSGIQKVSAKKEMLTPLNLKSSIEKSKNFTGKGTLLCINNCKECYFSEDISRPYEKVEDKTNLEDLEAYTLDMNNDLLKLEYGRYKDKKICLVLDFYKNGSSTQIILKQKESVYFLPAFFGEPEELDSLEDAKDLWLKYSDKLSSGDFY
ncbi:hypothetical protein MNB_SV-5-284 [hydrothermal vent metagenome]|uniref:Prepilin-type N-terminal cleavage/methylation domain-containing protein n=1 Tax=hydrothermal vent metagenome TaxID=652676 RepID=A0A1W1EBE4_9ZZZZ